MRRTPSPELPPVFWASLATSSLLIGINLFRWWLIDLLFIFEFLLELLAGGLFLVSLLGSLSYFVSRLRKRGHLKAFLPLGLQVLTLILVWLVPFTDLAVDLDFQLNLQARERVVALVKAGALRPNEHDLARLAREDQHLSKGGGEIRIERDAQALMVFFFTFRGVTDNYSGFIYRSNPQAPPVTAFGGEIVQIQKMRDHWFWAAFT